MLGDSLKLGIQSTQIGVDTSEFYFPAGIWCEVFNRKGVDGCYNVTEGKYLNQSTKAFEFSLTLREGHIIPM